MLQAGRGRAAVCRRPGCARAGVYDDAWERARVFVVPTLFVFAAGWTPRGGCGGLSLTQQLDATGAALLVSPCWRRQRGRDHLIVADHFSLSTLDEQLQRSPSFYTVRCASQQPRLCLSDLVLQAPCPAQPRRAARLPVTQPCAFHEFGAGRACDQGPWVRSLDITARSSSGVAGTVLTDPLLPWCAGAPQHDHRAL